MVALDVVILKVFWVYSRVKQIITEKWNIACHVSKQRRSRSSAIAASMDGELASPEGTQERTIPAL